MGKNHVLLQFDIDFKENEHLLKSFAPDIETLANQLKENFSYNPYIFYAGLSLSGEGVSFLMPVSSYEDQEQTFNFVKEYFASYMGIYVNESVKGGLNNLTGFSYDPNPIINSDAKILKLTNIQAGFKELNRVPQEIIDNGGVYLISDGRYTKVGYCSSSPFKRLGEIQVGNPEPLFVAGVMPGDKDNEEFCRNKLKKAGFTKKTGEWLKGNPARMIKVLDSQGFKVYSNVENN